MSDLIRLSLTTVHAPDAIALARFYAEITGGVAKGDECWALVEGPNGDIGFQQIDDYQPPTNDLRTDVLLGPPERFGIHVRVHAARGWCQRDTRTPWVVARNGVLSSVRSFTRAKGAGRTRQWAAFEPR